MTKKTTAPPTVNEAPADQVEKIVRTNDTTAATDGVIPAAEAAVQSAAKAAAQAAALNGTKTTKD